MILSRQPRVVSFVICGLVCLALFAAVSGGFAKSAEIPATQSAIAAEPRLTVRHAADKDLVTVTGQGFTPGGKVYLAIYDQMGRQLYEHRWVTASAKTEMFEAGVLTDVTPEEALFSIGGMLRQQFTGLCGASALLRALDDATERWTSFHVVRPLCGSTAGPTIANGLLRPDSFSNSGLNTAGATMAGTNKYASRPVLLEASQTSVEGSIVVSGQNFTAGGRVYVAIYDRMGAKLYETRWTKATPAFGITGSRAEVPEAHPITQPIGGELHQSFGGLCGAQVLIRAYNEHTATWSNWLDVAPLCEVAPQGYGPH